MKWRLYKTRFTGPGEYTFNSEDGKTEIKLQVDEQGEFEFNGEQTLPLHSIATKAGSKRDRPY